MSIPLPLAGRLDLRHARCKVQDARMQPSQSVFMQNLFCKKRINCERFPWPRWTRPKAGPDQSHLGRRRYPPLANLARCKTHLASCKMLARCKAQDVSCKMQDASGKVHDAMCELQDAKQVTIRARSARKNTFTFFACEARGKNLRRAVDD